MATSPELMLISAVIRTTDHRALKATGVAPEMFHQYPAEGKWLLTYISKHSKAPTRSSFRDAFPDVGLKRADDVMYYVEEVKKAHTRHAIMTMLDSVVETMDDDDIDKAIGQLRVGIAEVQTRAAGVSDSFDAFRDYDSTYQEVLSRVGRVDKNGLAGIPTGFKTLDEVTGGLQPGWFSVFAARLGQGKTWTGIRIGVSAAMVGYRVKVHSLEQNKHQVAMRMHSFAARKHGQYLFNALDLSRGTGFNLMEYKQFLREFREMMEVEGGQFIIDDTPRGKVTPAVIASGIERDQPDLCIIDYITLLKAAGDDWRGVAQLSADIQGIGQEYMIPMVGLAQVNRSGTGKEPPSADNLSQADAIGHDADLLVTMAKPSPSVMKHKIAKFRHGPDGIVWYSRFQPGTGRYNEISYTKAQQLIDADRDVN